MDMLLPMVIIFGMVKFILDVWLHGEWGNTKLMEDKMESLMMMSLFAAGTVCGYSEFANMLLGLIVLIFIYTLVAKAWWVVEKIRVS